MNNLIESRGRKFFVVIMAGILLLLVTALAAFAASREIVIPGVGAAVPILASCLPAYLGANAIIKARNPGGHQ